MGNAKQFKYTDNNQICNFFGYKDFFIARVLNCILYKKAVLFSLPVKKNPLLSHFLLI